jgi:NAD(P) transhydrogenase subunit alpha
MSVIAVPRERRAGETRVAATPETVERLVAAGFEVWVERGAGEGSLISDEEFAAAGASLSEDAAALWSGADAVLTVGPPSEPLPSGEMAVSLLSEGAVVVGFMAPHRNLEMVRTLTTRKAMVFALELVPRTARAQAMDALSSQASITGYRAVVWAAGELPRYMPLLMTAAGTVRPARVLVVGAGVAGLQAVATARRLGARVRVSDIRAEAKEQAESLGAEFVDTAGVTGEGAGGYAREVSGEELSAQQQVLAEAVADADVVITAALVPGKPAPQLVTAAMVDGMRPGSVVVDLAAEEGGNCEVSRPDEVVTRGRVRVAAPTDLPARQSVDASALYARNVCEFVLLLDAGGALHVDRSDDIVSQSLLTADGAVAHEPTAQLLEESEGAHG